MADPKIESSEAFFNQFLGDYFEECDELLTSVRVQLLTLEKFLDKPVESTLLDELFRSFHTLKGISAMVGLSEAETLAHNLESSLRILREANHSLTQERLNFLVDITESLVRLIESHRAQRNVPDAGPVEEHTGVSSVVRNWNFTFSPTAEGVANGFNVNTIRARLQDIGNILKATPTVRDDGTIAFEFIVATARDESLFASLLQASGVVYAPIEVSATSYQNDSQNLLSKPQPAPIQDSPRVISNLVRVDLERLNELMLAIGEVGTTRARLEAHIKRLRGTLPAPEWRTLQEIDTTMSRQIRVLRDGVMRVRMVPLGEIFERMRFVVRDLARENGKKVELQLAGENTEIDKLVVQRMMDPLLHLVRNAVSHGLESVEERLQLGKPPSGRLTLRGATVGDSVVIEVEDDGRGIDVAKVESLARQRGLIGQLAHLEESELFSILAAPSFSTRERPDRESGRGVGLDVVKQVVEDHLHGSIQVSTQAQKGTRFTIHLPLTLALADAFLTTAGGQTFAIPQSAVREIIEIDPASIKEIENNEVLSYRNGILRLIRLDRMFRLRDGGGGGYAMVVGKEPNLTALIVDRVLGHREIVVRAANDPLLRVPAVAGATEIDDGRLILILDVRELLNTHRRTSFSEVSAVQ